MRFKCWWCGHPIEVAEERRGKRVTCPGCKFREYVGVIRPSGRKRPGMPRPEPAK